MRRVLFVVLALFLGGCVSTKPTISLVSLDSTSVKKADFFSKKSLKIVPSSSTKLATFSQMSYSEDGKIYHFNKTKWQDSPQNMIAQNFQKNLRDSKLFNSVVLFGSISKSDFILELNIEEFMHYFNQDSSYVGVSYSLVLVDTKSSRVVASKAFSTKKEAKTQGAIGGVNAYKEALDELFVDSIEYISEVLSE
ncbi:MAG: ABC-type transport auxiliary lipoprotein family protein [Sulfurimonas sp.]|jgi:cholesterol transport system auxiliary component|nr:ABC-type transport auxiliary lipoprotein family protein [Sulfurimonadaceae bacterium]